MLRGRASCLSPSSPASVRFAERWRTPEFHPDLGAGRSLWAGGGCEGYLCSTPECAMLHSMQLLPAGPSGRFLSVPLQHSRVCTYIFSLKLDSGILNLQARTDTGNRALSG